jgi:RecB family exonuclease
MIKLSASRIKTLETCSFLYYTKYVLKLPDKSNKGAELGTVTHLVLECLTFKRRRELAEDLLANDNIYKSEGISRLVDKHLNKLNYGAEEKELINKYCLVALRNDFFIQNFDLGDPEKSFELKTDKYHLIGFIDKYALKDSVAKVVDYKTSKQKFSGEDAKFNVQALAYSLAAMRLWPQVKKVFINFLFLKFPNSPKQVFSYSKKELDGFEKYLEYLTELLENFTEKDAKSNLAYFDYNKKRLCGSEGFKDTGEVKWICPYQKPYDYWVLLDKDGKQIKSYYYNEKPQTGEGQTVELRSYFGCPAFNKKARETE